MAQHPHSDNRTLNPGTVVRGRYVVEEKIAEGGMASIHRTLDRKTGKYVALKALYPYYCEQPIVCTGFLDEGRIQRYLEHPNIIDVFEIVETSPLAIIMEYIQGPTLEEYLAERGPLNTQEILNLMLPVLSAVGFAHQKGIIHRDLKPSNILLEETPTALVPKVMDFGVAKVTRGQDLTADGTTVGTLHYMSPEQIVGSKGIDGRADIYSLGVTLYKLCTGEVPFNAATEFALMMAQVEAPPTPPSQLRPEVSQQLEAIILRTLAKKPGERFQNIGELTGALIELKEDVEALDHTETLTLQFPEELLRHAMMANEVAVDRTSELDILESAEYADLGMRMTAEGDTAERAPGGSLEPTMQLDRGRLRQKMLADREAAQSLKGDDLRRIRESMPDTKDTRPIERETTRERNTPDSRAFTLPFQRPTIEPSASAETTERPKNPRQPQTTLRGTGFNDPPVEAPRSAPADLDEAPSYAAQLRDIELGEAQQFGQENTAQPEAQRADLSQEKFRQTQAPMRAAQPQKFRREDAVDGFRSPEFEELRARAAGANTLTDVSPGALEEFGRSLRSEAPERAPGSARAKIVIAAIVTVIVGLLIAFLLT